MSIRNDTFSKFLGIIDSVLRMSSDFNVRVIPFDESIDTKKIVTYDAQDIRPEIAFEKGNGGTLFEPVLSYLKSFSDAQSVLMVLSDGLFKIDKAPELATLFLISDKRNMKKLESFGDVFYFDL